jgi:hypothetical protein
MTDANFDLCTEFPELCGMTVNYHPPLAFANPDAPSQYISYGDSEAFSCTVTIQESFKTVQSVIDSMNHYENMGIEAGKMLDFNITMGARFYSEAAPNNATNIGEGEANLFIEIPELKQLENNEKAEEAFADVFAPSNDEKYYQYDMLADSFEYTPMKNETTGADVPTFSTVEFGFRISSDENEPTFMGIDFGAEMPYESIEWGQQISQWAHFKVYDNTGANALG